MGFSALNQLTQPFLQLHEWDNGAERIVHTTTIQILLCFGLLLTSNLLFGQPITCLMMPETPDSAANYFHDFCFYQDKLRINNQFVKRGGGQGSMIINHPKKDEVAVTYYQWTPFIIFLQVGLCVLPSITWKLFGLHYFYGKDFASIIRGLVDKKGDEKLDADDADFEVEARETHRWLQLKKREFLGMSTTMSIYVFTKWLTIISLLFQFYMMAAIYADGELLWGVHISYDLLNGVYKNVFSGVFPQIVGCKTHRTQLGGVINEFVMRCILPQNFINSKVFLFLYWWYILAILVSFYSALQYTALLLVPRYQRYSMKGVLPSPEFFEKQAGRGHQIIMPHDSNSHDYFADYLGNDGYLLTKCASVPISVVTLRRFLCKVYEVVVIKGGIHEEEARRINSDDRGNYAAAIRNPLGTRHIPIKTETKREKQKSASDSMSKPLLSCSSPSSSTDSHHDRYISSPEKYHCADRANDNYTLYK